MRVYLWSDVNGLRWDLIKKVKMTRPIETPLNINIIIQKHMKRSFISRSHQQVRPQLLKEPSTISYTCAWREVTGTNWMSCLTPIQVDLTGSPQGESYAYENYYIYVMDKYWCTKINLNFQVLHFYHVYVSSILCPLFHYSSWPIAPNFRFSEYVYLIFDCH